MSDLANAIKQICEEKGLSYEAVIQTIESALAAAYRKDFGEKNQNIKVEFNPETNQSKAFDVKTVVEDVAEEELEQQLADETTKDKSIKETKSKEASAGKQNQAKRSAPGGKEPAEEEKRKFNPKTEIQLSEAKLIKKTAKLGDEIKTKLEIPAAYGRMAAQTAKQVIIQKLREAERDMIYNEFKNKENEVIAGVVQRREGRLILVDLGKAVGVLLPEEQIFGEKYKTGERIKVYVREVNLTPKGPEIVLSRTSDEILKKVFYLEIPEISNGLLEIKAVAREAGSRSKVAVVAVSDNVDAIGSCVGQRGTRIQTIINELGGEKIDIIEYDEDPAKFITNALSPAKIIDVETKNKEQRATVKVADDQLSLAIGKDGQNVRLAARLTGWRIDIVGEKSGRKELADKESAVEAGKADQVSTATAGAIGETKTEEDKKEAVEVKRDKIESQPEKQKQATAENKINQKTKPLEKQSSGGSDENKTKEENNDQVKDKEQKTDPEKSKHKS